MNIERQDKGLVNWNNVFRVDINLNDWKDRDTCDNAFSVRAYAAATEDKHGMQPIYAVLFQSEVESDCDAYLEWLKRQLRTPRTLILHTFVPPSTGEVPDEEQHMGKLWHNLNDAEGIAGIEVDTYVGVTEETILKHGDTVYFKTPEGALLKGTWESYMHEPDYLADPKKFSMVDHGDRATLISTDRLLLAPRADTPNEERLPEPSEPIDLNTEQFT